VLPSSYSGAPASPATLVEIGGSCTVQAFTGCQPTAATSWTFRVRGPVTGAWTAIAVAPNGGDPFGPSPCPGCGGGGTEAAVFIDSSRSCSPKIDGRLRYRTGQTLIDYMVTDLSHRCVDPTVSTSSGAVRALSSGRPRQSGTLVLRGRDCGPLRVSVGDRSSGFSDSVDLGQGSDGNIVLAHGNVSGPDGETLRTGDSLCTGERGAGDAVPSPSASDATASQLPPLEASIFPADVHGLERALHLHVGSNAALWFGFGKYSPDGGCVAGVPCEIGAGTAVTGSLIDVPAAHISIAGAITAQHVTLALGNGHTVTISPPESSPATVFPGGQDPIRAANLLEVRVIDERTLESLTVDGLVETLASVVVKGPFSSKNGLIGVDGDIEFQNGANGFGSVFAEGNITVRGTISFHTPLLYALASRTGNVNLFGTG